MEADLFMYTTGIYSDGDSGSEISETTASASVVSALSASVSHHHKFTTNNAEYTLVNHVKLCNSQVISRSHLISLKFYRKNKHHESSEQN
jgi:hypothetical protein